MEDVRERLKVFLKHTDLTNSDLARMIGKTSQNVTHLMKSGDFKSSLLQVLCKETNIDIHWLLTGSGRMERIQNEEYAVSDEEFDKLKTLIANLAEDGLKTRQEIRDQKEKIKQLEEELGKYKEA